MIHDILKKFRQITCKKFTSKSVIDALSPVLFLAKFYAFTPFKYIVKKRKSKTVLSIPYLIWFIMLKILYFSCLLITVMNNVSNMDNKNNISILELSEKFQIYTNLFAFVYLILDTWINKDDLAIFFQIQEEVDSILKSLGCRRYYHQLKFKMFLRTNVYITVYSLYGIADVFLKPKTSNWASYSLTSTLYTPVVQIGATLTVFTAFVHVITLNLATLNEEITTLSRTHESTMCRLNNTKGSVDFWTTANLQSRNTLLLEKINFLWNVYIKICDSSFVISRYFSGKVLVVLAMSFLYVLLNFFFLLSSFFKLLSNDLIERRLILFAVMQFLLNSSNIIVIIRECDLCEQLVRM